MKELLEGILIIVVIVAVLGAFAYFGASATCHAQWRDSGYETRFGFFTDCVVHIDNRWVPADKVKIVRVAK